MGSFDAVLFDCDGVLVDSERVAIRLEAQVLAELGWPIDESEIIERFVGRSDEYMQREVERHLGREIDWGGEFEHRYREVFERDLTLIDGVGEMLDALALPYGVASNSGRESLRFKLGLTGLLERFEGAIFSLDDVEHAKPAPDLYLHAARTMGFEPAACAVVEDSLSGVRAGLNAGMRVFAFINGLTDPSKLDHDGVVIFDDMRVLPGLLVGD